MMSVEVVLAAIFGPVALLVAVVTCYYTICPRPPKIVKDLETGLQTVTASTLSNVNNTSQSPGVTTCSQRATIPLFLRTTSTSAVPTISNSPSLHSQEDGEDTSPAAKNNLTAPTSIIPNPPSSHSQDVKDSTPPAKNKPTAPISILLDPLSSHSRDSESMSPTAKTDPTTPTSIIPNSHSSHSQDSEDFSPAAKTNQITPSSLMLNPQLSCIENISPPQIKENTSAEPVGTCLDTRLVKPTPRSESIESIKHVTSTNLESKIPLTRKAILDVFQSTQIISEHTSSVHQNLAESTAQPLESIQRITNTNHEFRTTRSREASVDVLKSSHTCSKRSSCAYLELQKSGPPHNSIRRLAGTNSDFEIPLCRDSIIDVRKPAQRTSHHAPYAHRHPAKLPQPSKTTRLLLNRDEPEDPYGRFNRFFRSSRLSHSRKRSKCNHPTIKYISNGPDNVLPFDATQYDLDLEKYMQEMDSDSDYDNEDNINPSSRAIHLDLDRDRYRQELERERYMLELESERYMQELETAKHDFSTGWAAMKSDNAMHYRIKFA